MGIAAGPGPRQVRSHTRDLPSMPGRRESANQAKPRLRSPERDRACTGEQANGKGRTLVRVCRVPNQRKANDGSRMTASQARCFGRPSERGEKKLDLNKQRSGGREGRAWQHVTASLDPEQRLGSGTKKENNLMHGTQTSPGSPGILDVPGAVQVHTAASVSM